MAMSREEFRGILFEALRSTHWNQFNDLVSKVASIKAQRLSLPTNHSYPDPRNFLDPGETGLIHELVWSLIIEGVLAPGTDDNNLDLPFLHLTEYGARCLAVGQLVPQDPEGYLAQFRATCPHVDNVIMQYITESLQCFLRNLNKAAAIMLGAASEQAILLLIDAWIGSINDPERKSSISSHNTKATSIFKKFELFQRHFHNHKGQLPPTLSEDVENNLVGIFNLIRHSRNDAGHPARMTDVSRDVNFANLRMFVPYCERIYALMDWYKANPT